MLRALFRSPFAGGAVPLAEKRTTPRLSQSRLIWRRFKKNRVAVAAAAIVILFYLVAILADFLAVSDPTRANFRRTNVPPQALHWTRDGRLAPHVHLLTQSRDPATLETRYQARPESVPVHFLVHGYRYDFLGIFPTDLHIMGAAGAEGSPTPLHLLGTDTLGRDVYSRLLLALRTSLLIGLLAVAVSLAIGTVMGIVSGYFGGHVDLAVQRLIEILRAIPTIPLWMGLAAAIPASWSIGSVYLAITLIIALIGWTELARELRGRIIALRHEDYVMASRLCGAGPIWIMRVHLLPACVSHIIAATTLAIPGMIASETALGFLGLGLRAPAISLGVMLKDAQDIQNLAMHSWLLIPAVPTAIIILAFNFMGDGLRDAADPYA